MEYIDLTLEWKLSNMVKFVDELDAQVDGFRWVREGKKAEW